MDITSQQYHAAMEMLYDAGQWYRLPRWVFKIRPNGEKLKTVAYTLAALLDQSAHQKAVHLKDGWLDYDETIAEDNTGLEGETIRRHLKTLADCGLIEIRRKNEVGGSRIVRINYDLLVGLMLEVSGDQTTPPKTREAGTTPPKTREAVPSEWGKPYNKVNTDKEQTVPRLATAGQGNNGFFEDDTPKKHKPVDKFHAQMLYDALAKNRKLPTFKINFTKWCHEFALLRQALEGDTDLIEDVLEWYTTHMKDAYVPEAMCGLEFRKKFRNIQAAKERPEAAKQAQYKKETRFW